MAVEFSIIEDFDPSIRKIESRFGIQAAAFHLDYVGLPEYNISGIQNCQNGFVDTCFVPFLPKWSIIEEVTGTFDNRDYATGMLSGGSRHGKDRRILTYDNTSGTPIIKYYINSAEQGFQVDIPDPATTIHLDDDVVLGSYKFLGASEPSDKADYRHLFEIKSIVIVP